MTEQEIMQKINDCDRQIVSAYNNLRSVARDVGSNGYQAAQSACQNAISEASSNKTKNTVLPLIISVVGFFMFSVSGFLGFIMLVGGIVIAYNLNKKADEELKDVQSTSNQMVRVAEYQQRNLNSILDSNTKI